MFDKLKKQCSKIVEQEITAHKFRQEKFGIFDKEHKEHLICLQGRILTAKTITELDGIVSSIFYGKA